jgi:hypothetical protein
MRREDVSEDWRLENEDAVERAAIRYEKEMVSLNEKRMDTCMPEI